MGLSIASYTPPSAAAWHHYAALFDFSLATNEVDLYIDGALQTPNSRPINSNNTGTFVDQQLFFMSRNGSSNFGAGRLAEFSIWPGIILPGPQVRALMAGAHPLHLIPGIEPNYWPLDARLFPERGQFGALSGRDLTPPPLRAAGGVLPIAHGSLPMVPPLRHRPFFDRRLVEAAAVAAARQNRLLLLGAGS